ncbi:predicted protein [Postia placenta Mad-698-R]|nr:predicted protein [Postia placenta Mad-698-R]
MDDHTPPGDTHGGHVEHAYAVSPPHFAFDDAFSDADDAEERLEFSPEAIREDIAKTFTNLDKHVAQDEAEDFARKIGRAVARVRHGQLHERGRCGARVRIATASYKLVDGARGWVEAPRGHAASDVWEATGVYLCDTGVLFAARNMMTVQRSRDRGHRAHCKGIRNIAGVIERTQGTQKHRNMTPRQGERDGKPGMVANVSGPHNLNQLRCNSHVTTYQWDTVHYGLVECIRMVSSRSLVQHNTMCHVLSSRFGMYWSPTTPATPQIARAPLPLCHRTGPGSAKHTKISLASAFAPEHNAHGYTAMPHECPPCLLRVAKTTGIRLCGRAWHGFCDRRRTDGQTCTTARHKQDGGMSDERVRERRVALREGKAAASRTGMHVSRVGIKERTPGSCAGLAHVPSDHGKAGETGAWEKRTHTWDCDLVIAEPKQRRQQRTEDGARGGDIMTGPHLVWILARSVAFPQVFDHAATVSSWYVVLPYPSDGLGGALALNVFVAVARMFPAERHAHASTNMPPRRKRNGGMSDERVRERRVARRASKAAASRTGMHGRICCEGNVAGAGCLRMTPPASPGRASKSARRAAAQVWPAFPAAMRETERRAMGGGVLDECTQEGCAVRSWRAAGDGRRATGDGRRATEAKTKRNENENGTMRGWC